MQRSRSLVILAVVGVFVGGCAGSSGQKAASSADAEAPVVEADAPPADKALPADADAAPPEAEAVPSDPGNSPDATPSGPSGGVSQAGTEIQSKVIALDFGTVDVKPRILQAEPPAYPRTAREAKVEGRVLLGIEIDTQGHPQKVTVRRSVMMLDEAAVEAAWEWRFTPALRDGRPIPVKIEIPFDFKLR